MTLTKVRSKLKVIDEARTKGAKVHFASLMDICHLKNAELETKHQKYKILWKMILDLMRYLQNKDHQHHKWQQQKSWTSYPECQVAMDKQRTLYLIIPKWKWKMLQSYWKFQNRNVQTFGFVYHDTNGLNHGPVWKIPPFLLSEICTVILWQDCNEKDNFRKSYWSTVGRSCPIGNTYSYTVKKGYSYLCMWKI